MMLARALGLLTLVSAAACASAADRPAPAHTRARPPARTPAAAAGARYFQGIADDAFWVTHEADRDRVVAGGARLELSPDGLVLAAAWEAQLWALGEPLLGALAVAPHLGGGFVHWTKSSVFRSREFTGALTPVAVGLGGAAVRGARNGLRGVVIFTEAGPRELLPGADRAGAFPDPALFDTAALDGSRAVRLDVFGRAETTADGGKSWLSVASRAGISARAITVAPDELSIETWQGKITMAADGTVGAADGDFRRSFMSSGSFQLAFTGTRATDREDLPWVWRETTPLIAATVAGALLPDGTALVLAQSAAARVDPRTGEEVELQNDWLPSGLSCAPLRAADGVLLLCAWDDYQGYGSYVLRSERGEPPVPERAFSDDGYFVADDRGAIGFVGSCRAVPRARDDDDPRRSGRWGEITPGPVLCVRRGQDDWVERQIEADERRTLISWVPRRDGTAIALVRDSGGREALPGPAFTPRVSDEGGVSVVKVYQEAQGWYWTRPAFRSYGMRGAPTVLVDKRFEARDDGGADVWLSPEESPEAYALVGRGATIGRDGAVTLHPLPPDPAGMVVNGSFGVVATRSGDLYETLDHGRSFRRAGRSPVPPSAFQGSCSELGCALGPVVRMGWGGEELEPSIAADPDAGCKPPRGAGRDEEICAEASRRAEARDPPPPVPVLSCSPRGLPTARQSSAPQGGQGKITVETSYGDEVLIVRDSSDPEPEPTQPPGQPSPAPPATAAAPAKPLPGKGSAPALRTHTLLFRPPFDLQAEVRRLNATNLTLNTGRSFRRIGSIPLMGPKGEVALLLLADGSEMLVGADDVVTLPPFEQRRYYYDQALSPAGLFLAHDRAVVLGDARRRTVLEEHGPDPQRPPVALGLERDQLRRRPMALARRDDGALGVLVLDGTAPETAGAALIDPATGIVGAITRLAPWSTLTAAGDPSCRSMKGAWRALVVLEPSSALRLDPLAYPGAALGDKGIAQVRWGRERACLEAVDLAVSDARRRGDSSAAARLIARWGSSGGASIVSPELLQPLECTVAGPAEAR